MLFPFALLSAVAVAFVCSFCDILWPAYLWAVPLMFVCFFLAAMILYVLFLLAASFGPHSERQKRSRFYHFLVIFSMGILLKLFRVKPTVIGEEKLPCSTQWLLVSNHRSAFDPIATCWLLRKHGLSFIAKPSIFKIPIASGLLKQDFYLPIDRENNREALKTILCAADYIKRGVTSMGIYPEGTRSRDAALLPFKNGAFKIAQRAVAPVVVAAIEGTENIMKRFPWRSTKVQLTFLGVLDTQAANTTAEMSERAWQMMREHLGK